MLQYNRVILSKAKNLAQGLGEVISRTLCEILRFAQDDMKN